MAEPLFGTPWTAYVGSALRTWSDGGLPVRSGGPSPECTRSQARPANTGTVAHLG